MRRIHSCSYVDPFAVHRDHVDVDDGGRSDARRRLRRLRRRNRQHEEDCRHWRVPDRTSIQHAGRNEEWKQTPAGGEHRVNPSEALSNPSLELKLYGREILLTGSAQDENNPIVDKPDLSKVDEIGSVDLLPGSGHGPGGWIDVAAIEVFSKPVKR